MNIKSDGYSGWNFEIGDEVKENLTPETVEQLKASGKELAAAINALGLADDLFRAVLKNRAKAQARLLDEVEKEQEVIKVEVTNVPPASVPVSSVE